MPRGPPDEPIREGGGLRRLSLRQAPLINVVAVNTEAKEIGGDESGLLRLETDVADDDAVRRGDQPTLPVALANQDRGANGKNTGNVIKTHENRFVQFMISSFIRDGESGVCRRHRPIHALPFAAVTH